MEPIKEPRLRTGTKRAVRRINDANGKFRKNGQSLAGPAGANYLNIVKAITNGDEIDANLYREHKGRSDTLLMTLGILHIHLYPNSKELLFLRQFDGYVEFIEINDHTPFDDMGAVDYFEKKYRNILWTSQREMTQTIGKSQSLLADAIVKMKKTPIKKQE